MSSLESGGHEPSTPNLRRISSTRLKRKVAWQEQCNLQGFDRPEQLGGPPKLTSADDVKLEEAAPQPNPKVPVPKTQATPKGVGDAGGRVLKQ